MGRWINGFLVSLSYEDCSYLTFSVLSNSDKMAIVELDPLFIRALRLLHSKSKESDVQLKSLLDECIRQRKAGLPINIPTPPVVSSVPGGNVKGRETEKNLDRLKRDLSQLVPGVPTKKPRMEVAGSSGKMSSSSMTPSPTASLVVEEAEDMDIDFQGLNDCVCCVCGSFNQENGNKLMECHTCQKLYHQECHNPVITDEEANDPRLIWNCSACKPAQQTSISAKSSISGLSKNPSKSIGSSSGSRVGSSGSTSSSSSSNSSAIPVDKRLQMMKKKSSSSSSSGNGSSSSRDRKAK